MPGRTLTAQKVSARVTAVTDSCRRHRSPTPRSSRNLASTWLQLGERSGSLVLCCLDVVLYCTVLCFSTPLVYLWFLGAVPLGSCVVLNFPSGVHVLLLGLLLVAVYVQPRAVSAGNLVCLRCFLLRLVPFLAASCPKCSHSVAYFMQIQIRSADEPMTTFFKCCNSSCNHRWREG